MGVQTAHWQIIPILNRETCKHGAQTFPLNKPINDISVDLTPIKQIFLQFSALRPATGLSLLWALFLLFPKEN